MTSVPRLTDGVVVLDEFLVSDVSAHLASEDDESRRWLTGGKGCRPLALLAWVARNQLSWQCEGAFRTFALRDRVTGRLAGMVEADLNWASCGLGPGDVNLSYQVYPWAQGQHFAQRAVHLVCAWLPTATTATTAVLWVEPANTASLRVAERGGFADCGLFTTSDGDRYRYYRYNLGKQRSQASA